MLEQFRYLLKTCTWAPIYLLSPDHNRPKALSSVYHCGHRGEMRVHRSVECEGFTGVRLFRGEIGTGGWARAGKDKTEGKGSWSGAEGDGMKQGPRSTTHKV